MINILYDFVMYAIDFEIKWQRKQKTYPCGKFSSLLSPRTRQCVRYFSRLFDKSVAFNNFDGINGIGVYGLSGGDYEISRVFSAEAIPLTIELINTYP